MMEINDIKNHINNKSRLIGVDMGSKRVGLSISDENRKIATPLKTVNYENIQILINQLEEIAIENNVHACKLKCSAQNMSQPQMLPKGYLGDPLDAPWTALGSLRGSVGRSGGSWDALWSSSGALWELCGGISELSGTILETF